MRCTSKRAKMHVTSQFQYLRENADCSVGKYKTAAMQKKVWNSTWDVIGHMAVPQKCRHRLSYIDEHRDSGSHDNNDNQTSKPTLTIIVSASDNIDECRFTRNTRHHRHCNGKASNSSQQDFEWEVTRTGIKQFVALHYWPYTNCCNSQHKSGCSGRVETCNPEGASLTLMQSTVSDFEQVANLLRAHANGMENLIQCVLWHKGCGSMGLWYVC